MQAYGKATLVHIDERSGASLRFRADRSGIDHFNPGGERTRSIVFARNAAGRIVAVHDPAGLDAAGQAEAIGRPLGSNLLFQAHSPGIHEWRGTAQAVRE